MNAPDPGFEGGWADALRRTLDDPAWPRSEARSRGLEAAYDAAVAVQQDRLFALPDPPSEPNEQEIVTSATGLVVYATCPQRYQWAFVDPLPRRSSDAARRGTDVHRRIELHNLGVVPLTEIAEATYDLTPDGDEPAGDPFRTFEESRYSSTAPLLTEVPFELHCDSGRVRGRIDAVYPSTDDGWEIVDFKSGRDRPDGANLVQLQTYALAAADAGLGLAPPSRLDVSFVYLGGTEPVVRLHTVDDQWLENAAQRVNGLLDAIGRDEWPTSPSRACRSCDFLRFCRDGREHVRNS